MKVYDKGENFISYEYEAHEVKQWEMDVQKYKKDGIKLEAFKEWERPYYFIILDYRKDELKEVKNDGLHDNF